MICRIFVTTLTTTRKSGSYFFLNPPKLVSMNLSDFTEHKGRRGHSRDRMIVWFTTTYAISAYHHCCSEFESRSGRGEQHYVIKSCQWLATGQWFSPGPPFSSTNKTDFYYTTEILLKVALNNIQVNQTIQSQSIWSIILFYLFFFSPIQLCNDLLDLDLSLWKRTKDVDYYY
jgi:hypothetical protein